MDNLVVAPRPVFSRTRSSPSIPGSPKSKPRASPSTAALLSIPLPVLIFDSSLLLHSANQAGKRAFRIAKFTGLAPDVTEFVCQPPEASALLPVEAIKKYLQERATQNAQTEESDWAARSSSPIRLRSFDDGSTFSADAIVTEFWPERPSRPTFASAESTSSIASRSSGQGSSRGSNTPNAERDSFFPATASTGPWFCLVLVKRHSAPSGPQPHLVLPRMSSVAEKVSPGAETATSTSTESSSAVSSSDSDFARYRDSTARARNMHLSDLPSPVTPPLSSEGTLSSKGSSSLISANPPSSQSSAPESSLPRSGTEQASGVGITVSSAGIQLAQSVPVRSAPVLPDLTASNIAAAQSALASHAVPKAPAIGSPASIVSTTRAEKTPAITTPTAALPRVAPSVAGSRTSTSSGGATRPTALPPLAPKETASPGDTQLFQLASLRSLPRTGVIIADSNLQKGYVNALARELLMGIPVAESAKADWWEEGIWFANDGLSAFESSSGSRTAASGSQTTASSSFFPGSPRGDKTNPLDRETVSHRSVVKSGEAKVSGGSIVINKPDRSNAVGLTIANILTRSLLSTVGALKTAKSDDEAAAGASGDETGKRQPDKKAWKDAKKTFLPAGVGPGKKPYKMYDAAFSQRIIDPLEPLLERCARRGDQPGMYEDEESAENGDFCGMVVGIEVEVIANEPGFEKQASGKRKRVRRRLVQIDGAPIMMDGLHWGGVITLRDITNEKRLDAVAREPSRPAKRSDSDFKQILDQMPQMVWTTTPLGSHDFFNMQWYEYTGLEPEESLGVGWQNPFHEDDMPQVVPKWKHSLETGDPYSVEYRCRRYDGAWRWMLGRALPYRDQRGEIKGWFGTCTDVDDFVRLRAKLAKTQEQMTAILKGASILIWVVDRSMEFTFFEGQGKDVIKQQLNGGKRIEGSHLRSIWKDDPPYDAIESILSGEQTDVKWKIETPTKTWILQCSMTPYNEKQLDGTVVTTGVIFVATDITDLTLAQERLEASLEERSRLRASEIAAKEASRLKSDYLMATSHEIRTPIAGMIGMAELLLSESNLTDSNRVAIGKILRSGEILLEMVGMVLDMGKVEAGKLDLEHRPFLLDEIITDARIFSIAADKKGLAFVEDVAPLFPKHVVGDMPRLRQVISNLLSNAIKFTSQGSVTLRVRQEEDASRVVLTFQVVDTGIGIRKESISSLFKPFHQAETSTSRLYGGTGLGLAICKNLIDLMGGSIDLESEYQHGTTMTVRVPLAKAPDGLLSSLSSPENASGSDILRESVRILVADDNELIREIITKTLKKMRFQVRSAINGVEALRVIEKEHIDLILMDGQMPEMDGYETTRALRSSNEARLRKVKIIALTASAVQGDEEKCLGAGMDAYLTKPVRAATLEKTILEQLSKIPASERGLPTWRTNPDMLKMQSSTGPAASAAQAADVSPPTLKRTLSSTVHFAALSTTPTSSAAAIAAAAATPQLAPSPLSASSSTGEAAEGTSGDKTLAATMALAEAPEIPSEAAIPERAELPRRPSYPGYSAANV